MSFLDSIGAFASAHPALMTVIVWPLLTAILTTIFKPQTPEQYAKLAANWPRLADFWRFVGAIGLDPVKAALVLHQILFPSPPTKVVDVAPLDKDIK